MHNPAKVLLLTCLVTSFTVCVKSQSFQLVKENSEVHVTGTSNLHDWKMKLKAFDCSAAFKLDGTQITAIDKSVFTCKPTNLESESSLMDKKAYAALKSKTYPEIKFNLTRPVTITQTGSEFAAKIEGDLLIAGKTNPVTIPVTGVISNNSGGVSIEIKGSTKISMKSFDISPPTAVMGTLKTGDNVTVHFTLQFKGK
jgi:polyisoprenoid-binding protein YceI